MTKKRFYKISQVLKKRQPDLTVLMENVHKEHNLAAIARTCDAIGIQKIHAITTLDHIQLKSDAASGSGKWIEVHIHDSIESAYKLLKKNGFTNFKEEKLPKNCTAIVVTCEPEKVQDLKRVTEATQLYFYNKLHGEVNS